MERSPWRCRGSFLLTFTVKLWRDGRGNKLMSWKSSATWYLPHLVLNSYWLFPQVFRCFCTQILATTKLNFIRNWKLKLKCSWVFTYTMMLVFHILSQLKKGTKRVSKEEGTVTKVSKEMDYTVIWYDIKKSD